MLPSFSKCVPVLGFLSALTGAAAFKPAAGKPTRLFLPDPEMLRSHLHHHPHLQAQKPAAAAAAAGDPPRPHTASLSTQDRTENFGPGWTSCNRSKHASLVYLNNKDKCYSATSPPRPRFPSKSPFSSRTCALMTAKKKQICFSL